jgi:hypothetical protein
VWGWIVQGRIVPVLMRTVRDNRNEKAVGKRQGGSHQSQGEQAGWRGQGGGFRSGKVRQLRKKSGKSDRSEKSGMTCDSEESGQNSQRRKVQVKTVR